MLFANYYLGRPEVLDFQFRNAQKEPYILCLRKKPNLEHLGTLSNLSRFSNFCTAGKRIKFAIKRMQHYSPHLRYVATRLWEIENSNFLRVFNKYERKCQQIAF